MDDTKQEQPQISELDRAYDALAQAHAAGNKEHAQQLADYIRTLEPKTQAPRVPPEQLESPVLWGIGGAGLGVAGSRATQAFEQGQLRKMAEQARVNVPEEVIQRGRNAVINYIKAMHTGDINYVGGESYKEAHALTEQAKEKARMTPPGYKYDFESGQYLPEAEYNARQEQRNLQEKARVAAEQKRQPFATKLEAKSPGTARIASGVGNVLRKGVMPPFIEHSLAGYYGGQSAATAANRLKQGDIPGAAISGTGTLGSALTISKNPKARALGLGLMGLSYGANKAYESPAEEGPGALETARSLIGRAAGGLAHLADGGKPPKVSSPKKAVAGLLIGKAPQALSNLISKGHPQQTVSNPLRMEYPGIYERPDIIAQRAVENTAPENPLLKRLFGVTRDDLYEMSKRQGNMPGVIPGAAKNPKGSAAAEAVMTPQNERRILDIMSEIQTRAPGMYQGMHGWYVMDPEYQRLVQLVGKDEAGRLYRQLNVFGGIESPNMPVPNEFRRASAAHMLAEQGRFPEWQKFGGLEAKQKLITPEYPSDLLSVPGRVGHQRASSSQEKYLRTGQHGMDSPKAPPYIEASSVPELGFQTDLPVGDAHWSRGVGLADVRTGKSTAESVSTPEIQQLAPWWREKIAAEMGTESVPSQAILWGGLGPYTGVKTAVGAPKLELHAIEIGNAAKRLGVSPETARDLILMGKERAGRRAGGLV